MAKIGSFSTGATGNVSVVGFTSPIQYLRLSIAGRSATNETVIMKSNGFTDGSLNKNFSIYQDSTGARSRYYNDRCIGHLNRVSGTLTEIIKAVYVSFDNNGGGDYGFTLNFTSSDVNYPIIVEAF